MKITHDYAARIDYDLWMDCMKVKELDGGTTSINCTGERRTEDGS